MNQRRLGGQVALLAAPVAWLGGSLLLFVLGGCEGAAWTPQPVGAPDQPATTAALGTTSPFDFEPEDATGARGRTISTELGDATDEPAVAAAAAEPKVLWLWYADGGPPPGTSLCTGTPPAFSCSFGTSIDDCKKQVQSYLDRWYGDFNLIFTYEKPSVAKYYTEIVSVGGNAWCNLTGLPGGALGVAPAACSDLGGSVCYTFTCASARICAQTIAQEHAHLVGLLHTTSRNDLLYPSAPCSTCDQFENADNTVAGSSAGCRTTQNSYQLMHDRLGAWPGGTKPPATGGGAACTDAKPPTVMFTAPADGATVAADFTVSASATDDCGVTEATISASGQTATSSGAGPFGWDLTGQSGAVTITVTAKDGAGHTGSASITVHAPSSGGGGSGGQGGGGGGSGGSAGSGSTPGNKIGGGCALASGPRDLPSHPWCGLVAIGVVLTAAAALMALRRRSPSRRSPSPHFDLPRRSARRSATAFSFPDSDGS